MYGYIYWVLIMTGTLLNKYLHILSYSVHVTIPQRYSILKLGNFPRVTQILSARAQIWSRLVQIQIQIPGP